MMSDIVERLRNDQGIGINLTLCREAADEIERLRARIAALEEALNSIDSAPVSYSAETLRKIARAALAQTKKPDA
jgi:hypothetical protein